MLNYVKRRGIDAHTRFSLWRASFRFDHTHIGHTQFCLMCKQNQKDLLAWMDITLFRVINYIPFHFQVVSHRRCPPGHSDKSRTFAISTKQTFSWMAVCVCVCICLPESNSTNNASRIDSHRVNNPPDCILRLDWSWPSNWDRDVYKCNVSFSLFHHHSVKLTCG